MTSLSFSGLALGGNLKHAPAPQLAYAAAPAPQLAYAKVHAHASEARVASAPQQYSQVLFPEMNPIGFEIVLF